MPSVAVAKLMVTVQLSAQYFKKYIKNMIITPTKCTKRCKLIMSSWRDSFPQPLYNRYVEHPNTKTTYKEKPIASFYSLPISGTKVTNFEILEDELKIRSRLSCRFIPSEDHKTPTIRGVLTVTHGSHTQRSLSIEPTWPSKAEDK